MTSKDRNPQTPQRNDPSLDSASSRKRCLDPSPGRPSPRRVVLPASPPPNVPTSVERPRRLTINKNATATRKATVDPILPPNVPTEPAAMRRTQQPRPPPQATQYPLTPRRRVVPNILPGDEADPPSQGQAKSAYTNYVQPLQPCLPFTPRVDHTMAGRQVREDCCSIGRNNTTPSYNYNYNARSANAPFYHPSPQNVAISSSDYNPPSVGFSSYNYNPYIAPFVPSLDTPTRAPTGFVNYHDTQARTYPGSVFAEETTSVDRNEVVNPRNVQDFAGTTFVTAKDAPPLAPTQPLKSQKVRNIAGTELVNYTKDQQAADYADLMADSQPEETWESRRGAPMVPDANSWIESDMFAQQWYNAIILSYRQDAKNGERLGGTDEEKLQEMRAKQAGHLTGVSVGLEVERHNFEADLLRRARDMILRDNGIMPRGGVGNPAVDGEPQPWSDGMGGTRSERR